MADSLTREEWDKLTDDEKWEQYQRDQYRPLTDFSWVKCCPATNEPNQNVSITYSSGDTCPRNIHWQKHWSGHGYTYEIY